jgi:glycosyltransferase involved in cell wall biosynthesis
MRVLHVYKDYAPVVGGIENHVRLLAESQAAAGHRVTVLVTSRTPHTCEEDIGGVHVIKAARLAHVASTPLSIMLPWHLAHQRPDVSHLHYPYPVGETAQLLFGHSDRVVLSYHADVVRQASILRFYRPLLNKLLARVDRILVASPNVLEKAPLLQPFRYKCVLVPYGINRRPFLIPRTDEIHALHRRYGAGPWLLFVGVLRYYKGLDYLLRAMIEVPARLMIVGDGPMGPTLRAQVQSLGLSDRVAFAGRVSDADLPVYYQAADIFVLPSCERSEAYGLVQVEAMTSGLPVICTELDTGTTFVNRHGESGLVVPPRDPAVLATAITALLDDDALRSGLGQGARARSELFAAEHMLRTIDRVYKDSLLSLPSI